MRGDCDSLRAYLDRYLDDPTAERFRDHLVDCDRCHARMVAILVADAEAEDAAPAIADRAQEALAVVVGAVAVVGELGREAWETARDAAETAAVIGKFLRRMRR